MITDQKFIRQIFGFILKFLILRERGGDIFWDPE